MRYSTYYYEIPEQVDDIAAGVYYFVDDWRSGSRYTRLFMYQASERAWAQGPKGGVRLIRDQGNPSIGYITRNQTKMKEFMWIKLRATKI